MLSLPRTCYLVRHCTVDRPLLLSRKIIDAKIMKNFISSLTRLSATDRYHFPGNCHCTIRHATTWTEIPPNILLLPPPPLCPPPPVVSSLVCNGPPQKLYRPLPFVKSRGKPLGDTAFAAARAYCYGGIVCATGQREIGGRCKGQLLPFDLH